MCSNLPYQKVAVLVALTPTLILLAAIGGLHIARAARSWFLLIREARQ